MNDVNILLYRNILPGTMYDAIIPKSTCKKIDAGTGFTDLSINLMVEVVQDYSWQMSKLAQLLKKSSLEKTINAIHNFEYNHYQYYADESDQYLRSPACSWYQRKSGIDCKSYSIIASAILTELNIAHYIRKTSYDIQEPNEFTHVYVVVPIDQKTYNLNNGYYNIDGTIEDNSEPYAVNKKDQFMSGLKHYVLNGPGLRGEDDPKWIKKISIKNIKTLLKTPIGCWGGTAYSGQHISNDIDSVNNWAVATLNAMNDALNAGNMTLFSEKANEFLGISELLPQIVGAKRGERGWNSCSISGFNSTAEACNFFDIAVSAALETWLDTYFNSTVSGSKSYDKNQTLAKGIFNDFAGYITPYRQVTLPFEIFSKKNPLPIPNFNITEYTYSVFKTPQNFNPDAFIKSIQDLYGIVQNPLSVITGGATPPINPNTGTNTGTNYQQPVTPKTTEAGMGILGWLLIGSAVVFGINGVVNTKTKN